MVKSKIIRDIVYGFVTLDPQEQAVIDHPAFQRLRRIKQLSLTDMLYPGANHTRFEHSIGVMQMASDMFDSIINKPENKKILEEHFSIKEGDFEAYKKIVRLAALLHDIGHTPFSHPGEELMPIIPGSNNKEPKRYKHEAYSIAIIREFFRSIIEDMSPLITVDHVTALLDDPAARPKAATLLWKSLISGQLDADRADYLLRDSKHLGVSYGLYDRERLVECMTLAQDEETQTPVVAIQEKGWHIAESLVIARYQMFSQVYFHKVRRIYDYHISCAAKEVLQRLTGWAVYPDPTNLERYLDYDDWKINAAIKEGLGGEHGEIIKKRRHFKQVNSPDCSEDVEKINALATKYRQEKVECYLDKIPAKEWYKISEDILIEDEAETKPLSEVSMIVYAMKETPPLTMRLYAQKKI